MAFVGGNQQFPGQFPVTGPFQSPPVGFPQQQGIPLTAAGLPQLNFGAPPQQQFPGPQQNFIPPGVQGFNPLFGPQVPGGGGAVFGGSPQPMQGGGLMDPNLSTSDFYDSILKMQFATGDFISTATGVATQFNDNGSMMNVRQLSQQFQGLYQQVAQQEGDVANKALEQYSQLKESMFTDSHYEFDAAGKPSLHPGAETLQQRAQRQQYERRQSIAVEQAFANHPLAGVVQQINQAIDFATKSGQNTLGLQLALDQAQTQLGLMKTAAHLQAEGIPSGGNQSDTANAAAKTLSDFGNSAISDYAQMHQFNVQNLASNPITQAYFEAMAQQTRGMMQAQQGMQTASTQLLGMLGGGGQQTQPQFNQQRPQGFF